MYTFPYIQESQAMTLLELLYISGGPAIWDVLRLAQVIYEYNRDLRLHNLLECIVIDEPSQPKHQALSTDKVRVRI